MLTALFGGAAMLLVLGSASNRWVFMLSVFVFALLSDMYRPAAAAMVADVVRVDRRHHAFALMYISINLGFAIAPPVGGLLAEYSFQWLFWGDALTMALYGVIVFARIPETLPRRASPVGAVGDASPPPVQAFTYMVRDVPFLVFCLATLLTALVFMQGFSTLPIYLRQSGLSNLEFGLLMSINGSLIFLLQLPMTQWLGRFNAMSVVIVGGILISLGYGLNAVGTGLWFFAISIAIWTSGEILQAPFTQSIVTALAPTALRARYMGVFNMCFATALTIGAPLGGAVLNRYGATTLWSSAFAIALIAVFLYLSIRPVITARHVEATRVETAAR
jgi:MFS family permease